MACASEEKGVEEQEAQGPQPEEYVGTYKIQETINDRYCEIVFEKDSLYLVTRDIGKSAMIAEENEVFDVPGHKTRMRFLRDEADNIDRIVVLTQKGRFTAIRVEGDSIPPAGE